MGTFSLMLHVTAAAALVGPQFLMFYAVTPSTWLIGEERIKRDVLRVVARRFARLAGTALVLLLATGLYQLMVVTPAPVRDNMLDYRFGEIFLLKMTLFVILVVLIIVHGAFLARRVGRMSDEVIEGRGDAGALETARAQSLLFSGIMLIVSVGILMLGASLGHHEFSYVPR